MPYIKKTDRELVDKKIDEICHLLSKEQVDFLSMSGILNYTITRICSKLMGQVKYGKIAVITGVLENVKQEFYRRVASSYEDQKIIENGDVKEYLEIKEVDSSLFFSVDSNPDSYLEGK